ncbi:hypothetical protein QYF36_001516 [Acer negundo]|nr:hypothetical protein QYF36_001516 [Acer negundo]
MWLRVQYESEPSQHQLLHPRITKFAMRSTYFFFIASHAKAPKASFVLPPISNLCWNSVIESVVNGVPLIAWPLYAEQRMNAVMLTENIELALRLKQSENGLLGRDEISRV